MKRKTRRRIWLVSFVCLFSIAIIGYFYSTDQIKQRGFEFGVQLQSIQSELKVNQLEFDSIFSQWEEGDLSTQEFIQYSETHLENLNVLLNEYGILMPPTTFQPAVALFELSTESQIQSDMALVQWVKTGDKSYKIRSDDLFQEAFQYELSALSLYNAAKSGVFGLTISDTAP